MSVLNDFRCISDDIWEYTEWLNEVKRESRREEGEKYEKGDIDSCDPDSDTWTDNI